MHKKMLGIPRTFLSSEADPEQCRGFLFSTLLCIAAQHVYNRHMSTYTKTTEQQAQLDTIKAGKALFTKISGAWEIMGPAEMIQTGTTVEVTKRDGTTKTVTVGQITYTGTKQGTEIAVAGFRNVETTTSTYTTKTSSVYGEGRIYRDQPGATQYIGINGRHSVQIWDEE